MVALRLSAILARVMEVRIIFWSMGPIIAEMGALMVSTAISAIINVCFAVGA